MIEKKIIIDKLVEYSELQLTTIITKNPMIAFGRPFAARAVNNYIGKADKFLSNIQDADGMIDIEGIIDEEIDILLTMKTQEFENFKVGNGKVTFTVPIINKEVVLTTDDIAEFKELLINYKKE